MKKIICVVLMLMIVSMMVSATSFNQIKKNFGRTDCKKWNNYCKFSDLNKDGMVDIQDFGLYKSIWYAHHKNKIPTIYD